ncbi:hypothetical protein ACFW0V_31010 [Micromonospora parva]|uniref:hypothetical protein n=1 Tax=Micromonospora parva TaxID=1464048 RepID=UPI003672444E
MNHAISGPARELIRDLTDVEGELLAQQGLSPEAINEFGRAWQERCLPLLTEAIDQLVMQRDSALAERAELLAPADEDVAGC